MTSPVKLIDYSISILSGSIKLYSISFKLFKFNSTRLTGTSKLDSSPSTIPVTTLIHSKQFDIDLNTLLPPPPPSTPRSLPPLPAPILFKTPPLPPPPLLPPAASSLIEVSPVQQLDLNRTNFIIESSPSHSQLDSLPPKDALVEEPPIPPPVAIIPRRPMKPSKVPSSRIGRLLHYGSLAAGLSYGAATEAVRRATSSEESVVEQSSLFMSEANVRRMVDKLSRMRGAALKLGQFMSIQDSKLLPVQVEQIMMEVQNNANYMPAWQTEKVLVQNLGPDWRSHFSTFDLIPFAAASIGQVHSATLSPDSPFASLYPPAMALAVKIQFPGVRASISSDLNNLKWLLIASSILPRGLYLENTIKVMKQELDEECDYTREAECGIKMKALLAQDPTDSRFRVPTVVTELCGPMVLTTEMMQGEPLTNAIHYDQRTKNQIGEDILKLCLKELFEFRFMQTDPNWSNFLYNKKTNQIELIDFGATRSYSKEFIDDYLALLLAAVEEDKDLSRTISVRLGYLTGQENQEMIDAHLSSLFALAMPFRASSPSPFPFGTLGPTITNIVRAQIPIMLKHRLTPPPEETYSLNRKLSGAFLLCERLESVVESQASFRDVNKVVA